MSGTNINNALPLKTRLCQGRYIIDKVLGAGGFGITYRVRGRIGNIEQTFAVKEYFMGNLCERVNNEVRYSAPVKEEVESGLKSFIAEAERLKSEKILHRNLVGINEIFKENNTAYYVMEYVAGKNIRQYAKERGKPFTETEAIQIIAPLLKALSILHSHKITHLDIKPDNILLSPVEDSDRLRPVIIDFGLSKHYDSKGNVTSRIKYLACSPGYAPNEQYQEGGMAEFTPQADIYALGATLLFMLTGKDPVVASEMNRKRILESLPEEVSDRTREALVNALRQDKSERTQNASSFAEALGVDMDEEEDDHGTLLIGMNTHGTPFMEKIKDFMPQILKYGSAAVVAAIVIWGASYLVKNWNTIFPESEAATVEIPEKIKEEEPKVEEDKPAVSENLEQKESEKVSETEEEKKPESQKPSQATPAQPASAPSAQTKITSTEAKPTTGTLNVGGNTWKGGIKNGKPHGIGTLTFNSSTTFDGVNVEPGYYYKGEYDNGRVVLGKIYDLQGKAIKTVMP